MKSKVPKTESLIKEKVAVTVRSSNCLILHHFNIITVRITAITIVKSQPCFTSSISSFSRYAFTRIIRQTSENQWVHKAALGFFLDNWAYFFVHLVFTISQKKKSKVIPVMREVLSSVELLIFGACTVVPVPSPNLAPLVLGKREKLLIITSRVGSDLARTPLFE